MEIFKRINEMNKASSTKIVKTEKKLPESYKKMYLDVKNLLREIVELESEVRVKKAKFQTDEQEKKKLEHLEKSAIIGGGCLSELFIEGYDDKPKDIDIFINTNGIRQEDTVKLFVEKANELFGDFTEEELKEELGNGYSSFYEIKNIVTGEHKQYPGIKMEIIFVTDGMLNYDLSIKEFYSIGEDIYATQKALDDIEKKQITINRTKTTFQSLLRAKEFAKRYNFEIERMGWQQSIKLLSCEVEADKEYLDKIEKKMRKYVDEKNILEIKQEVESVEITAEEIDDFYYIRENEMAEGMVFREYCARKEFAQKNVFETRQEWEVDVPKIKHSFTCYKHATTGEPVSNRDLKKLFEQEKVILKEMELRKLFLPKEIKRGNYGQVVETDVIMDRTSNLLEQLGYEKTGELITQELLYVHIKMDQIAAGMAVGDLMKERKQKLDYDYTEKEIKEALNTEKLRMRIGEGSRIWNSEKVVNFYREKFKQVEIEISYPNTSSEFWTKIYANENKDTGVFKMKVYGPFGYLVGERYEAVEEMIKRGMGEIECLDDFDYTSETLFKKFGNKYDKYELLSKEQREEVRIFFRSK